MNKGFTYIWKRYKKKVIVFSIMMIGFILFLLSLPGQLFNDPYSVVVEDMDGNLLGALLASDGQWRFPESENVPEKFKTAVTCYEDKNFFIHPGIDPSAILRAAYQNIKGGRIVSGGSTITMQVIRLSRKGEPRTFVEKLIEMVLAVRLELTYSKENILKLYSSHAPFGGNIVGLEAASWRYFGRSPELLSWAEASLLAVFLPRL